MHSPSLRKREVGGIAAKRRNAPRYQINTAIPSNSHFSKGRTGFVVDRQDEAKMKTVLI